jgi:hypothetical protein
MAMCISYPISDSDVPTSLTAWGTYPTADNPASGTCTMANGTTTYHANSVRFRSDGIWVAVFPLMSPGTGFQLDASYTAADASVINAAPETGIKVTLRATGIAPPLEQESVFAGFQMAERKAAGVAAADPIVLSGLYPGCLGIKKVVALVHQKGGFRYASVVAGTLAAGQWVIIIPRPADLATQDYDVEILLLTGSGLVAATAGRLHFPKM